MNEKCLLDVYYYIDIDGDVEFIEHSLKLQLTDGYSINKLVNYKNKVLKDDITKDDIIKDDITKDDIIRNGLIKFNEMFKNLKLKSSNETWFFYISSGNVKDIYSNVFVVLLNKNPKEQKCCYIINKDNINRDKQMINANTLSNAKVASVTICEVLKSEKTITYTNLNQV